MSAVTYQADASIGIRVLSHVQLGLQPQIQPHQRNFLEKAGDFGLYAVEHLPQRAVDFAKDPRTLTATLTTVLTIVDSYLFYPEETMGVLDSIVEHLPAPSGRALRVSAYVATLTAILSYSARAQGRFWREALMTEFYLKKNQ